MATNNREHGRMRYGICLSDNCSKAKAKEIQEISGRKDFVCAECGKPLKECPPPKTWWQKHGKKVIAAAVVVVAAGGITGIALSGGDDGKAPEAVETPAPAPAADSTKVAVPADTATADTATAAKTAETEKAEPEKAEPEKVKAEQKQPVSKQPAVKNGRGTVNLGYGKYTGDLKDGKPHGYGTITYTDNHKIVSSKDYVALPGDRFEGEFRDGRISGIGYWYHDGQTTAVKP